MERALSELLKLWRAERPDEWIMDEFIREAERMEKQLQNASSNSDYAKSCDDCIYGIAGCQHEPPCTSGTGKQYHKKRDFA